MEGVIIVVPKHSVTHSQSSVAVLMCAESPNPRWPSAAWSGSLLGVVTVLGWRNGFAQLPLLLGDPESPSFSLLTTLASVPLLVLETIFLVRLALTFCAIFASTFHCSVFEAGGYYGGDGCLLT
jgi:hypothetical protein